LKRIGFEVGKSFDIDKIDPSVRKALETAPEDAQKLMAWKTPTLARVANNRSMNTVYGNYYLKRAIVTQLGLGANVRWMRSIPSILVMRPANRSTATTSTRSTSTKAWSITLYDAEGFQVANPLNRFAVSSWMPFKYNPDGSLDLYFQSESPGTDKEANWLPAPKGSVQPNHAALCARERGTKTGKWCQAAGTAEPDGTMSQVRFGSKADPRFMFALPPKTEISACGREDL
jgi:hypothetical protein